MPSVLFVCTANICRSPIAMGLFEKMFNDERVESYSGHQPWIVDSAGTWAKPGRLVHENSRQVSGQRGIDIEAHRSQPVSAELLEAFDLTLTMEQGHKEALRIEFPQVAKRIFVITEMAGYDYDIPDPIGHPVDEYEMVYRDLERLLTAGRERIEQLVGIRSGS